MTPEDEQEKKRYGQALAACPDDAFKAALTLYPADAGRALVVAREWHGDPLVIETRDEAIAAALADDGPVIGKSGVAQMLLDIAREKLTDAKDRIAALDKINEMYGYKTATEGAGGNTYIDNRSVMIVKDHGTDDEWSAKLRAQQERLVADASQPVAVN